MMELSHSLTLNEEVLAQIAEPKRPVFVYEWLRFLDMVLIAAQTSDIKGCQKKLVEQLISRISDSPGPPTRKLIGRCLATLFSVGDTFLLFDAVNRFNEIVKNKDDSPSYLPTKLGAITCIGAMYERLGRMMGRSYEETVQILVKCLRNAESQTRCEIMTTMEKICIGMEGAINSVVKDVYKAARHCLTDRTMAVRSAAAKCLLQVLKHSSFLYTTELESLTSLCFRAFEGSNYDVRCTVGRLLGVVVAATQQMPKTTGKIRTVALDEAMGIMMTGFLRGGVGFLKGGAGEMIKGTSGVSREIRVGVTHAYVTFVQTLGSVWLERYQTTLIVHVLDLVSNPKAATTHVDAVHSRKCVSFILRSILRSLSEKAQVAACKDLCQIILRLMNSNDAVLEPGASPDQLYSQHGLVCALQELGYVVQTLGTTASGLVSDPGVGCNVVDTACSVLLYAAPAARLAAGWCLRSVCIAIPSQLTPLIDRCTERLEALKAAPEAVAGHSVALAALVGSTRYCPLGIPHARGKVLFNIAEDLLRSASQNSRMSLPRTHAGWLIIGSIMTLGPPVVRGLLPRMLLLWRISFPRSSKELESEKARGDAFTWQVTLEGRSGALAAIQSFVEHCTELVTPDVVRRLPIDSALAMLGGISGVIKSYGQHLKASAAMLRLRLYELLSILPASTSSFEASYGQLLRLLVAEFTLTENPANTTTSLLRAVCHADDSVILGSWLQETDHKTIEDQMEPNRRLDKDNLQPNSSSGSGALEHDPSTLYKQLQPGELIPGPLPLGVAVIDMSVTLFGVIFPRVAQKHRLQMLEHFAECIRQNKSVRQEAIQINVFTAVLSGMKGLADAKTNFGQDDVRKAAVTLVVGALTHSNPILRCASAEALGRMSQVIGDSRFVAEVIQNSFDKLKSARDVASRTGHSLALGCVHRHVGGMGSGQHLGTSVSILLALAQDGSSPVVQAWALHSLALIADSGGPLFRAYVEPTAALSLRLLLNAGLTSTGNVDVVQCVGKLLQTIITTIGPELHGNTNSMCTARSSFLCACAIMQEQEQDALVQAEATTCLQQLHMFAPRHVNLSSLVPTLCMTLGSSHLMLRRAAVSCLRQLSQREAREVCEHALTLATTTVDSSSLSRSSRGGSKDKVALNVISKEMGLPGVLFGMLDTENDQRLISDIHDTVTSMLQALAEDNLAQWLGLCKDVLTSSLDGANASPVSSLAAGSVAASKEQDGLDGESFLDGDSDEATFSASSNQPSTNVVDPRWPTRVFAAECVCRIIAACRNHKAHFDLALARELLSSTKKGDYLVLHLSDLVRMAFMAATSDSDPLRLAGLRTLQLIIDNFSRVPEPEFPGHVILEQYQAQVGAALRPAFSPDTSSHVTAVACQVCSAWIGSEVARDLNDLRRVHQLLVSSLAKLDASGSATAAQLYNESTATLEKLAILKAWAEVYVVAMRQNEANLPPNGRTDGDSYRSSVSPNDDFNDSDAVSASSGGGRESLLDLVSPELPSLSQNWLSALRDHAILSLTTELVNQQRRENGAFYSVDTADLARIHYRNSWTPILHAAALFLTSDKRKTANGSGAEECPLSPSPTSSGLRDDALDSDRFHLIFGICMEALCTPRSTEPLECVLTCLKSLHTLLSSDWARLKLESRLSVELCNVLHRLLLTRESPVAQLAVMDVVRQVVAVSHEALAIRKKIKLKELAPANQEPKNPDETALLGEGGASGSLVPGKSVVFAALEVCLCVLVRHLPALNPSSGLSNGGQEVGVFTRSKQCQQLTDDGCLLVTTAVSVMADVVSLCSPRGSVAVLPTILYLITGVFKEEIMVRAADSARQSVWNEEVGTATISELLAAALQSLKLIVSNPYASDPRCVAEWRSMLQSSLANILELSKTMNENLNNGQKVHQVGVLLAVGIFIISAPSHVAAAPNLHGLCLDLFKRGFESDDLQVRLTAVQTLESVFEHPDRSVSVSYIHALAGRIVEQLSATEAKCPQSDVQLKLTSECIKAIDVIVCLAEPQNRVHILTLAIPIYVKLLTNPISAGSVSTRTRAVHDAALQRLMKIGPRFPQDFCTVMAKAPQLRVKLEAAVRGNQLAKVRTQQSTESSSDNRSSASSENRDENVRQTDTDSSSRVSRNAPSIKLKTDFSNFTG